MISQGPLSLSQQEASRKNYNRFNLVNGMSYMCLGETIIILFALRLDAPDYIISMLGAFVFLGNFAMPMGKFMTARIGAARSISLFWILRNISAIFVATASIVSITFGKVPALVIVTVGTFLFYAFRSSGTAMMQPLIGEITTSENRGKFVSKSTRYFFLASLVTLVVISYVMRWHQDIWMLTCTIITGSLFGFTSTYFMSRVDETASLREYARQPIMADVIGTLRKPARRRQLIANCATSAALTLTAPITMLALKRGYGISDMDALVFSLIQFAAAIVISYVMGMLSEETGPKPLLMLFYSLLFVLCLLWIFAPAEFSWAYVVWPFIIVGGASMGIGVAMTQYFLVTIPDKERVAASLSIYVISGVVTGLVGIFVGGSILKYLDTLHLVPLDTFKIYFLVVLIILVIGLVPVYILDRYTSWELKAVLGLAFAPRDLITLFNLYSFDKLATPEEEMNSIDKLKETRSGLSEKALISSLDSPKFALRGRALMALGEIEMSPKAREIVMEELEDGEHTTANIAAQIAGNHMMTEAIPLLRKHLASTQDYYLKSKAMVALAQLKDTESYKKIEDIFINSENPRLIIHGAAALAEIGDDKAFEYLLEKTTTPDLPEKPLYEILCSIGELNDCGDDIYKFLKLYRKNQHQALLMLYEMSVNNVAEKYHAEIRGNIFDFNDQKLTKTEMKNWLLSLYKGKLRDSKALMKFIEFIGKTQNMAAVPKELILCMIPTATASLADSRK